MLWLLSPLTFSLQESLTFLPSMTISLSLSILSWHLGMHCNSSSCLSPLLSGSNFVTLCMSLNLSFLWSFLHLTLFFSVKRTRSLSSWLNLSLLHFTQRTKSSSSVLCNYILLLFFFKGEREERREEREGKQDNEEATTHLLHWLLKKVFGS